VHSLDAALRICRMPGLNSPRIYAFWGMPQIQRLLKRMGRRRAYAVYKHAQRVCPAYREFLNDSNATPIRSPSDFSDLPETNKANYVNKYSIQARCINGRIPSCGVVIDESSGSTGMPNNWIRGQQERESVARLINHAFRLRFADRQMILLNCFALGPWATGMNVSMAMADICVLKSIGPDTAKLENTLRLLGPDYEFVITGYPPFIKDWINRTEMDLTPFSLHLICGGEGYSLGLRERFETVFTTIVSSYGASDLEINIATETDLTISLRKQCADNPHFCAALFDRTDPPMIFQYNPIDYLIEQSEEGELVVTLLRRSTVAPKIRYNIRDLGGTITYRRLRDQLHNSALTPSGLNTQHLALPLLFVYGRNDLSVPFYGAKIFSTDLDQIINAEPTLSSAFTSFQFTTDDSTEDTALVIDLEQSSQHDKRQLPPDLATYFYEQLQVVNQDFREVSSMFTQAQIRVQSHPHASGPFKDQDIRLKRRYVTTIPSE
jgi:phenylacetate-CoA ligase